MADTDESQTPAPPASVRKRPTRRSFWFELPILILIAVLVAVLVRTFVVQTFFIPTGSMENTLLPNDRVLVNKMVYDFRDPRRGEVVVFKPPSSWRVSAEKDDYIKRVVGIEGDHVVCCDKSRITINGTPLKETYLHPGDEPSAIRFDIKVSKNRLFVLGDHRSASADSRAHLAVRNGTIPESSVVGRAFAIFWPVNHMSSLSIPAEYRDIGK